MSDGGVAAAGPTGSLSPARVLVADLGLNAAMANGIGKALDGLPRLSVRFWQQGRPGPEADAGFSRLEQQLDRFAPHEILIVLGRPAGERERLLLRRLRACSCAPVVAASGAEGAEEILKLFEYGIADFIGLPLREAEIQARVCRFLQRDDPEDELVRRLKARLGLRSMVGQSPAFVQVLKKIPLVAECDANALVTGETGTGKELCARAIHYLSARCDRPFVPVNCGAIPLELVENELFGHESAAFTGAVSARPGLIREAEGGTLFLDEIDSLPPCAQVKLLRFLQEKEYRALGSTKLRKARLRIIAATNSDPHKAVQSKKLRQDLYYRLSIIPLNLPPLRERREDIPLLARHFLARYAAEFKKPTLQLDRRALRLLLHHDWPGNVRELEHVLQRAVVLAKGPFLQASDIDLMRPSGSPGGESFQAAKARMVERFECSYIRSLLSSSRGNISQAARMARKNRRAFWELIRKHNIDVQRFKRQEES